MKRILSMILVGLILVGMFTSAFSVHQAKAEAAQTIYINADGSITPATAPIVTSDEVSYTLTANISYPLYSGIISERTNIIIDGKGYFVQGGQSGYGLTVSSVEIRNLTITNFSYGIEGSNCHIVGNTLIDNNVGMSLSGTNIIQENTVTQDQSDGVVIQPSSMNNTITDNLVTDNGEFGISLLGGTNNNSVSANILSSNERAGLSLWNTIDNIVSGNEIENNTIGIEIGMNAKGNDISHNNLINNTEQVYLDPNPPLSNSWDNGYPSGGNYWSDYSGTDIRYGLYQNETGSDGIGDTPYVIDVNNTDNYPLMNPWVAFENQTIYINADGSITPPAAPIYTADNITYTLTGNIITDTDGIVIERNNAILDGAGHEVQGNGSGCGILASASGDYGEATDLLSNATTKDCTIDQFETGIYVYYADNCTVSDNTLAGNGNGIYAYGGYISDYSLTSSNITIAQNIVFNNTNGIVFDYVTQSSISNNTITNNENGISFGYGWLNTVNGNIIVSTGDGISLSFGGNHYYEISPSASNLIDENEISAGNIGIEFVACTENNISRNTIAAVNEAIHFSSTAGSEIVDCSGNDIANNTLTSSNADVILLESSVGNWIENNKVEATNGNCINLTWSFQTDVSSNTYFDPSSNNTLDGNSFTAITGYDLALSNASSNVIYHNNFLSIGHAVSSEYSLNTWDNSYPSGGNYWSDYHGKDLRQGPYQNETGSDGIGDTPYTIDANNTDSYPLMNPWTSSGIAVTCACGFILNTADQAITDANVTLSLNTGFLIYETTTDSRGYFSFDAAMPGQYSIIVSAQEYASQTTNIQIIENQTSSQNVTLSHLPILTGYITTNDGQPISNASISVTGNSGSGGAGTSAPDGSYRLVISSAGVFTATASAHQFSSNSTGIICSLEQTIQENFSLTTDGTANGQVIDELSNNGVANATVILYNQQFPETCQTRSDGSFSENLSPGNYTVDVGAPNYLANSSTIIVYSSQTTTFQIELMPTGNITGTVKDYKSGDALQNAQVSLLDQNGITLATALTDATGEYLFYLVPPSNYTLAVHAYGYNTSSVPVSPIPLNSLVINFTLTPSIISLDVQSSSPQFSRGETANFTITPKNAQGQPISDIAEITATMKGPANETKNLVLVQQGNNFVANYTFLSNETMGTWTATFFVRDSLGNTAEAIQPLLVKDAFLIDFQTDKSAYVPTDNINFTAYVMRYSNTSLLLNASQVSASVEIFNPQNMSVDTFSLTGMADSFSGIFSLSGLQKGTYNAYLNVSDSNGDSAAAALSFTISDDFQATVQTDRALYNLTDTVQVTGSLKFANGTSLADTNLQLSFTVKGLLQNHALTTDNLGDFEFLFTPYGIAGNYTIICSATVNGITRSAVAEFSVLGLLVNPLYPVVNMPAGATYDLAVQVSNTGETRLTGVSINVSPTNTNGVSISIVNFTQSVLTPDASTSLFLHIDVSTGASSEATFNITTSSNEGSVALGILDVHVYPATPVMDYTPQIIDLSLSPGDYVTEQVTVKNIGYGTLNNVALTPPNTPWITVTSTSLGNIAPQDSESFNVLIAPQNDTSLGLYQDQLYISSSNYNTEPVYLDVKITTAQNGSLTFHITDDAGEKVANATITVQCQEYYTQAQTALTDSTGYCLFSSLPGGRYSYTIVADNHHTVSGTTIVQPDSTVDVEEVLPIKMMDVSFTVLPTPINDNYYINLTMTFETSVPEPLLIPVPPVLQFGADRATVIQAGFAQTMSFDLHNVGLIPVQNVSINVEDGAPTGYGVALGVFGKKLSLSEIAGQADIQVPCTLRVTPGTNIDSLDNGVVCKINITGYFIYFDANDNPLTAQVNAEVLVQILDEGSRWLDVDPSVIYEFQQSTPSLTLPISGLPDVTITNRAGAEQVNICRVAVGGGVSGGVDITGPGLGAFAAVGLITKEGPIPAVNQTGWINLEPNEQALLQSAIVNIPSGLDLESLVKMFLNLPGISASAGFIAFFYQWQYDSTIQVYPIPILLIQVTTFSISLPVIAGSSGGGGGSGLGWWEPGQTNITVAPPSITPIATRPTINTPQPVPVQDAHEVVKLTIPQKATLERDAFQANLQMTNTLSSNNIENVNATLSIAYTNGSDARQNFYFNVSSLQGISDVDGTGIIQPGAAASASWLIIPLPGAGGTDNEGVYYTIQAQIFYTVNQMPFNLSSSVETINVQPQPYLTLDYYLPQNVTANVPFKLGIRVTNTGYGTAHDFKIDSAQPIISENLAQLPINFNLIGSYVQGTQVINSLNMVFGDIQPGQTVIGYWLMVSTLNGTFTKFTATYTHSNALGAEETSLITVTTHILMRDVMINDTNFAFLIGGNKANPDQIVDTCNGTCSNVTSVNYNVVYQDSTSLTIQTEKSAGNWICIPVNDPFNNQKSILEIQRSDGKTINPQNYWMANGQILILDDPGENYTILYNSTPAPAVTVISPQNQTYNNSSIPLIFSVLNYSSISWIGYSLDGQSNVTIAGNSTLNVGEGAHNVVVFVNDTYGNSGSSQAVYFNCSTQAQITFAQTGAKSDYTGTVVVIDGTSYNGTDLPVSFTWGIGSSHSFAYQSPLLVTSNGQRYVWYSTSGPTTQESGTIIATSNQTITENYKTQYYLTTSTDFGIVSPASGWFDEGSNVTLSATSPSAGSGEQYAWNGWNGTGTVSYNGTGNPCYTIVNSAITELASWTHQWQVAFTQTGSVVAPTVNCSIGSGSVIVGTVPFQVWVDSGSSISYNYESSVTSSGIRYVLTSTNPTSPQKITAASTILGSYKTQYYVTFAQNGLDASASGTVVTVDSSAKTYSVLPFGEWVDAGKTVSYTYSSIVSTILSGKRFRLNNVNATSPLTVSKAETIIGTYKTQYLVTFAQSGVGSDFSGTVLTINRTTIGRSGRSAWYDNGSKITFGYRSPLVVSSGKRYFFISANGTSPLTVSKTETIVGTYRTQYYLTMSVSPAGEGTVAPGSGWYFAGSNVSISITARSGYVFLHWLGTGSGSYSGSAKTKFVTMNGPIKETAMMTRLPVPRIL